MPPSHRFKPVIVADRIWWSDRHGGDGGDDREDVCSRSHSHQPRVTAHGLLDEHLVGGVEPVLFANLAKIIG